MSGGRTAQQAGSNFESWIETQHEIAERLGILAHVEHSEPHAKMIGGRLTYASPGTADYFGTLDRCGLSYACEAKSTSAPRFQRSGIEPKQQKHLEAVARAGGLALLLVEFRYRQARFAIPWLQVPWEVKRTAESITPDSVGQWYIDGIPGDGRCYLSKFHEGGPRTSAGSLRVRKFARE